MLGQLRLGLLRVRRLGLLGLVCRLGRGSRKRLLARWLCLLRCGLLRQGLLGLLLRRLPLSRLPRRGLL